jgi:hypothetical protein
MSQSPRIQRRKGWTDMLGQIKARTIGANNPTETVMGGGSFTGWKFVLNDAVQVIFHWPHDAVVGDEQQFFCHAHWTTDGTSTATVKWEFTYSFAKGFGQGVFNTTGTAVTVEEAAAGVAWTHMTSEITTAIDGGGYEFDGLLLVKVKRITNGGTDNTDGVFLHMADLHYLSDRGLTPLKTPLG